MALNPILNTQTNEPIRIDEEYFIVKKNNVSFEAKSQNSKIFSCEGKVILTSNRIVIINNDKNNLNFKGFEIPFTKIYNEKYIEPVFGKNYISGEILPLLGSQLGRCSFFLYFKTKENGTFVNALFKLIDSLRSNQNLMIDNNLKRSLELNEIYKEFSIDINDDSLLYEIQPESIPIRNKMAQSVMIDNNNFNNNNRLRIDRSLMNNNINNFNNNNQNVMNTMMIGNYKNVLENNNIVNNQNLNQNSMSNYKYIEPKNFQYKNSKFEYKDRYKNNVSKSNLINPYLPNNNNNNNNNNNFGNNYFQNQNNQFIQSQFNYNNNNNNNNMIPNNFQSNVPNQNQIINPYISSFDNSEFNNNNNYFNNNNQINNNIYNNNNNNIMNNNIPNNMNNIPSKYESISSNTNNNNFDNNDNNFNNNNTLEIENNYPILDENISSINDNENSMFIKNNFKETLLNDNLKYEEVQLNSNNNNNNKKNNKEYNNKYSKI